MAEFRRGIRAGVLAGIISGFILAVLLIIIASIWGPEILGGKTGAALGIAVLAYALIANPIIGLIGGIIFGAIYAGVYNSLPCGSSPKRGMVLGIIWWIVFVVALGSDTWTATRSSTAASYILVGLISSLIWGGLVGKFWDLFE